MLIVQQLSTLPPTDPAVSLYQVLNDLPISTQEWVISVIGGCTSRPAYFTEVAALLEQAAEASAPTAATLTNLLAQRQGDDDFKT